MGNILKDDNEWRIFERIPHEIFFLSAIPVMYGASALEVPRSIFVNTLPKIATQTNASRRKHAKKNCAKRKLRRKRTMQRENYGEKEELWKQRHAKKKNLAKINP